MVRTFVWENAEGKQLRFTFRRFVSLHNLHLIGLRMEVESLRGSVSFSVASGIDAQQTNTGSQHFHEGEKRIYDKMYLELLQTTTESKVDFVMGAAHRWYKNGTEVNVAPKMEIDRRKVAVSYSFELAQGDRIAMEKTVTVYTSRDKEFGTATELTEIRNTTLDHLKAATAQGYDALFQDHSKAWANVWNKYDISIQSKDSFDILGLRFAIYHLVVMTPAHDSRMGIGAKGLSGEGYKGHSFWDTEIFIFPFYLFSNPSIARSLLEYRYSGLEGARRKAIENGYAGAMYPWEAAWPSDGEVTPVWGAVDIVTGEQTKIWSGFIEQHITSDVIYAVWQYYKATGDQEFMDLHGYEMIFDTATFWASRLEWCEDSGRYLINEVVGPDEYKEHVDNNAFTNYMAHFNISLAIQYYVDLQTSNPALLEKLSQQLNLEAAFTEWTVKESQIYLPQPNEDLIIPQDDTYLHKKIIDLTKYKNQTKIASIFDDYNLDQVGEMQVSKQADIMMLFFLLEDRFSLEVKRANYNYYEPKTLHDSSLSLSTHSILASDFGDRELAYNLFRRATEIDLGPYMHSSDAGIDSASLGGIWEGVVMGFGGVRLLDGKLHLHPKLPKHWDELSFSLHWQGESLKVVATQESLRITSDSDKAIEVTVNGRELSFVGELEITI